MIYILDQSPALIAQYLDDRSLGRMIKAIADTLKIVYYRRSRHYTHLDKKNKFANWGAECIANYRYLVELGLACCNEYTSRFTPDRAINWKEHKYQSAIEWARDKEPDLPEKLDCVNLPVINTDPNFSPLVMPDKYQVVIADGAQTYNYDVIESYRNYYRANLAKGTITPTWTRRAKPEFLENVWA